MNEKIALVLGASGLVGTQCLSLLLSDDEFQKVVAIVRRPLPFSHPRLIQKVIDFRELGNAVAEVKASHLFCCLGTTLKQAGSKEKFRQVDYEYPLIAATSARQAGTSEFLLVSALGANPSSSIFYNRVKGELEQALSSMKFPSLCIFRPSLLVGERESPRLGEKMAEIFLKGASPFLRGRFRKYRAITAKTVALAMIQSAKKAFIGIHTFESDQIQALVS